MLFSSQRLAVFVCIDYFGFSGLSIFSLPVGVRHAPRVSRVLASVRACVCMCEQEQYVSHNPVSTTAAVLS